MEKLYNLTMERRNAINLKEHIETELFYEIDHQVDGDCGCMMCEAKEMKISFENFMQSDYIRYYNHHLSRGFYKIIKDKNNEQLYLVKSDIYTKKKEKYLLTKTKVSDQCKYITGNFTNFLKIPPQLSKIV